MVITRRVMICCLMKVSGLVMSTSTSGLLSWFVRPSFTTSGKYLESNKQTFGGFFRWVYFIKMFSQLGFKKHKWFIFWNLWFGIIYIWLKTHNLSKHVFWNSFSPPYYDKTSNTNDFTAFAGGHMSRRCLLTQPWPHQESL